MSEAGLQAFVIHQQCSGETSARVTFFTREKGLIPGLCKGGRMPQKQAILQAFTPIWVYLQERSNWYYVQKIELLSASLSLEQHQLFAGLYLNELIFHALRPLDANSSLYDSYETAIRTLSIPLDKRALEALLRRFEWTLLTTMGQSYALAHDARSNLPVVATQYYQFIPGEGVISANQGILGAHLLALADDQLEDPFVLSVAKKIMRRAIDHALGGIKIKARDLWVQQT